MEENNNVEVEMPVLKNDAEASLNTAPIQSEVPQAAPAAQATPVISAPEQATPIASPVVEPAPVSEAQPVSQVQEMPTAPVAPVQQAPVEPVVAPVESAPVMPSAPIAQETPVSNPQDAQSPVTEAPAFQPQVTQPSMEAQIPSAVNLTVDQNIATPVAQEEVAKEEKKPKQASKVAQIVGTVVVLLLTVLIVFWIIKRYFLL